MEKNIIFIRLLELIFDHPESILTYRILDIIETGMGLPEIGETNCIGRDYFKYVFKKILKETNLTNKEKAQKLFETLDGESRAMTSN
jgi:hypothetical protein